jgi:hypothetical protein
MGIFDGKAKLNMTEFCQLYYENQIFQSNVSREDTSQNIVDYTYQLLTDSEPALKQVDRALFEHEMAAMNLELFALAFFQRFVKNINHCFQQSIFTRRYLYDKNKPDIWEDMKYYNLMISKTATWGMTEDTAIGRAQITFNNSFRAEIFEGWIKDNKIDLDKLTDQDNANLECVARAVNRIGTDILKNEQIGNRLIAGLFLERLGTEKIFGKHWQPNDDFLLRVASQPLAIYEFTQKILKTANLQFH